MKSIHLLSLLLFAGIFTVSCSGQSNNQETKENLAKVENVEVYYFHYTRRCATCNAIEQVSKDAITEFYDDKVLFADYNLDEPDGESKGNSLEVSGQSLLIVAGNTKIDLTNEAFLNARSNPEKLKQLLKEKIDPLLN